MVPFLVLIPPLVALIIRMPTVVDACSPIVGWRPLTTVEKVLNAPIVLYGQVLQTFPDSRFDYGQPGSSTVYTAELEVYCSLKGRRTDRRINITEAGVVQGYCHSTNLAVGSSYVLLVYANDNGGVVYSSSSAEIDATVDNLQDVTAACGLQQIYPNGVDESTATVQCPNPAPPTKCKSKTDFSTPAPPAVGEIKDSDNDYDAGDTNVARHPMASTSSPKVVKSAALLATSSLINLTLALFLICIQHAFGEY